MYIGCILRLWQNLVLFQFDKVSNNTSDLFSLRPTQNLKVLRATWATQVVRANLRIILFDEYSGGWGVKKLLMWTLAQYFYLNIHILRDVIVNCDSFKFQFQKPTPVLGYYAAFPKDHWPRIYAESMLAQQALWRWKWEMIFDMPVVTCKAKVEITMAKT